MTPAIWIATGALILDTFREALARKLFWGLWALATLLIIFFLFILKIDIVQGAMVTMSIFGQQSRNVIDIERLVRTINGGIATALFTWGLFLSVFASAGLTPSLLEPGRIGLLLSKPVPRWLLLLGRYLGNLLVISVTYIYLVLGIWLILGWKTGVWQINFFWTLVSTIFIFAVMLTVVTLIGTLFDSAALSIMVAVGVMLLSPILAQERIVVKLLSSEWSRQLWKGCYYVLPKVFDLGRLTLDVVRKAPTLHMDPWMPILTSAAFGLVTLGASLWVFARRDF